MPTSSCSRPSSHASTATWTFGRSQPGSGRLTTGICAGSAPKCSRSRRRTGGSGSGACCSAHSTRRWIAPASSSGSTAGHLGMLRPQPPGPGGEREESRGRPRRLRAEGVARALLRGLRHRRRLPQPDRAHRDRDGQRVAHVRDDEHEPDPLQRRLRGAHPLRAGARRQHAHAGAGDRPDRRGHERERRREPRVGRDPPPQPRLPRRHAVGRERDPRQARVAFESERRDRRHALARDQPAAGGRDRVPPALHGLQARRPGGRGHLPGHGRAVDGMSFAPPAEQEALRARVRELCAAFPDAYWRGLQPDGYPTEFVQAMTDGGHLAALIPHEYGGGGLGLASASGILEEVNRSGGSAAACHAQMYVMGTLLRHGDEAQKRAYLPRIAAGELRLQAFSVTEREAGSETTAIRTTATRRGDVYVVSGHKGWTSRALHSDLLLLLARTTPPEEVRRRAEGLSVFLVDLREVRDGVTIRATETMVNHHTAEVF